MKTIWKYSILSGNRDGVSVELLMKRGAKILYVAEQDGDICLWAMVDVEEEDVKRYFDVVGTGRKIHEGVKHEYVGSAQVMGGKYVFHIFEVK